MIAPAACAPVQPTSPGSGLSPGSIFLIVLSSVSAGYLLGGLLANAIRGKQGTELLPNKEFWISFFSHVKVMFLLQPQLFGISLLLAGRLLSRVFVSQPPNRVHDNSIADMNLRAGS